MDVARDPKIKKQKQRRRWLFAAVGVVALLVVTFAIYSLEPAAYPVDREAIWTDSVERGEMVRRVRGPGTLVPEEVRWLPARTQGRIERILTKPGVEVKADTVILELANPELDQELEDAQLALASARADFDDLRARLQSEVLEIEARVTQVSANREAAKLQADADRELSKEELIPEITYKRSQLQADQLGEQLTIENRLLERKQTSPPAAPPSPRRKRATP